MKIEFYTKNVYGNDLMYVKSDEIARELTGLLGTVSISQDQMDRISQLFSVEWVEVIAPKKA